MIDLLIDYLKRFIGTEYKLGGEIYPQDGGVDCSGLILEGLRATGKWGMNDDTAQGIFNRFKEKEQSTPAKGNLLFFGKSKSEITHVSLYMGDNLMIEAGGDNKTGMVRIRPLQWRKDLIAIVAIF